MSYKTILVHIADDPAGLARVDAAARLAESQRARLVGLATVAQPTPVLVEGSAAAAGIWAEQAAEFEGHARHAADAFLAKMRQRGIEAEARIAGGFEENAGGALALNARYADLTVIGGRDAVATRPLADALIDGALFDSGRAALIVPALGVGATLGARPMVAWDGGAQAARAAREALPFLISAAETRVCVAKTYFGMGRHGEEPGADVARWLSGHGAKVTVEVIDPEGHTIAEALAAAARRSGCDLIVMGGFGHSRLRESIFGGVTSDMVSHPPLPLLLAH
ncbi:MAG: universal stress protein [Rubrimonas sp.]|uniref:universal stress protein n=1 Tax=Rubrimonas sp. TaxID=2036015 RepID=UPI002FDC86C9